MSIFYPFFIIHSLIPQEGERIGIRATRSRREERIPIKFQIIMCTLSLCKHYLYGSHTLPLLLCVSLLAATCFGRYKGLTRPRSNSQNIQKWISPAWSVLLFCRDLGDPMQGPASWFFNLPLPKLKVKPMCSVLYWRKGELGEKSPLVPFHWLDLKLTGS